ncbi:sodium/proton-translocating pyrophosphatase [Brachybacterium saurashtrense]|uniref:Pyrophosphatase n=1 Tax=Brachybacterium saurashtrense TaxID=556288 RepID=A0A345YPX7_9MICO|nr:sodium/proton-translocating pyrophosphatase [Brachybacterium saurashtrense]AXK45979.1 pyrophosphatase [Brachybacterium saurashtrense]RRR23718.1 pyrophosphatase [Brachybacterium saurashtrense]
MDLITQFPLGDDLAWTLLALGALALVALAAGAIVPVRLRRAADEGTDAAVDEALGRRLGGQLLSAGSLMLWVGLPLAVLAYLAPGSTDDRMLRAGLLLAGVALGPLAAWRGMAVQLAAGAVAPERRAAMIPRLGALTVTGALALALLPIVIVLWFLQTAAGPALLALAAGAALSALAIRVSAAPAEAAASAAAVLVGADEHELELDDPENLGGPLRRTARMVSRGGALSADLVALTTALAGLGVLLGVPVLAAEGLIAVLLGLGVALLAAAVAAIMPHTGRAGHERGALRLGGLIPSVLGGAGAVAASALWIPSLYKDLRFEDVGLENFTDPAITGGTATPREQLEPQIEEALADMGQWVSQTDESQYATTFLDTLTLYSITPNVVVAVALGLGVLTALAAVLLLSGAGHRMGGSVLRAARTSRTGGALGLTAGLGSTALTAAGALALAVLVTMVISVLSAGVAGLALALLVHAALGALIVVAAHAGSLLATSLTDRADTDPVLRTAAAGAATGPRAAMLLAAVLTALGALGPVTSALQLAPRAATVWEDRALHAAGPTSLTLLGGLGLGVATVLMVSASLLDGSRRLGASAVVETRASMLEGRDRVEMTDLPELVRRAAVTPVVVAVLMPLVAGFGLGPAALPGMLVGAVLTAAALGVWMLGAGATLEGAAAVIGSGRYGGRGSWGHSGALGGAVLTGVLRSAIGAVALPLLLLTSLLTALSVSAVVGMTTDGTSAFLRWGIALVALAIALTSWLITATAPEVDLEDGEEGISRPLFARSVAEEQTDPLEAMDWDAEDSDQVTTVTVPTAKGAKRGKGTKRGSRASGKG